MKWERNRQSVDPDQTAPMRLNQGLHYLLTSLTSASFAYTSKVQIIHEVQILGNAMCREGYFLFLKKNLGKQVFLPDK